MENNTVQEQPEGLKNTFKYFPFTKPWQPIVLMVVIGTIFYSTSINNEYALEDELLIQRNQHVIRGVKGIKDIVTKGELSGVYTGCHY